MDDLPTPVTEPFLPPLEECLPYFKEIWQSKVLTNNGPYLTEFEKNLASFLVVHNISVVNNATTGLMLACKALELKGEIITTPFSFIATSHALDWIGLTPVFSDVDPVYGNLLPELVRKRITPYTGGILATHNFGFPAQIEELDEIAKEYNIPLIFDAAPAIGIKYRGKSLVNYGDASVLSFHATKVFTTFEGGAVHSKSKNISKKINLFRNFGIVDENTVGGPGINGKMNEFQSAIGLVQLDYIEKNIRERKNRYKEYVKCLGNFKNILIPKLPDGLDYNFAYFPVYVKKGTEVRDEIVRKLKLKNIFCRKYWSPLISEQKHYKQISTDFPNASKLGNEVISLPMGNNVNADIVKVICDCIKEVIS
jgi:dTDP-4-amino-4,6-dideoxygalactose transaminase